MKASVITRQWLFKTCSLIAALMVVVVASIALILHFFYYNTVRSVLNSGYNDMVSSYFTQQSGSADEDFNQAARSYIESYSARDSVGVWVIDRNGEVVATSDGFTVPQDVQMQDYVQALQTGSASWIGRVPSGEKIMAMTFLLGRTGETRAALRYMVSLQGIDAQFYRVVALLCLIGLGALALAVVPGTLFIEKMVRAVRKTTEAADTIAKGEYDTPIHYDGKDEIGDLCAAVHNMAEEIRAAERMKNDFISTVSHELRTPLTAIRGWVETLRQVGAEDAALTRRGMDVINSETNRLGGMVEELLDFSRIQSGALRLRQARMDVSAELDEAVFTFRQRAVVEHKTMLYTPAANAVPIWGDRDRIMQVFVNIIDNALKYTPSGGTIRIETHLLEQIVRIIIADTGKGIAPQDLPHIKEKFYKADTTVHGSGIGLAVADEIVRLHRGTLEIDSAPGEGTAVTITLPLLREDERSMQDA